MKDQGVNQATKLLETEYGAKATVAVERLLSQADSLIDSYLPPPQEGEEQQEASSSSADDSNVLNRALQVSNKFNKRMLAIGTIKVQATKKRVDDILATLNVVDVVQ